MLNYQRVFCTCFGVRHISQGRDKMLVLCLAARKAFDSTGLQLVISKTINDPILWISRSVKNDHFNFMMVLPSG